MAKLILFNIPKKKLHVGVMPPECLSMNYFYLAFLIVN